MNLPPDPAIARAPDLPNSSRNTPPRATSSWPDFAASLGIEFAQWLATLVILGLLRWSVIFCFVGDLTLSDALQATLRGARFDAVIAGLLVLPSSALGLAAWLSGRRLGADRVRAAIMAVAAIFLSIVYVADFGFFAEFGCHLDQRVLAASDDWHAIIQTIWARHHPLLALLATVTLATLWWWAARGARQLRFRSFDWLARVRHPFWRGLIVLAAGYLLVGSIRGLSFGETPVRIRNSFVTGNQRLNRTIPTPFATLLHDLEGREAVLTPPSPAATREALAVWRASTSTPVAPAGTPVAGQLRRTAHGALHPPRHVFLIILEGQHGFPLLPAYRPLGLLPGLAGLADDGAYFTRVLPAAEQTNHTLAVLLAGLLVPSTNVLHAPRATAPFGTSLAPQFARLGYHPQFFYGGYLGWSRLEQFATGQGFSEIHGAGQIRGAAGNAWGVWDEFLFDYVLTKVDPAKPSLNVILTTTSHSPYDLDPSRRRPVPPPAGRLGEWDAATRAVVEHEAYADRAVAAFVTQARTRFPEALFVITGDHVAHAAQFALSDDPLFAGLTVPLILTGNGLPAALRGRQMTPASQLDIVPTLFELCAPAGFAYASLGTDLFSPTRPAFGLGHHWVVAPDFIAAGDSPVVESTDRSRAIPTATADHGRRLLQAVETLSAALLTESANPPPPPAVRETANSR